MSAITPHDRRLQPQTNSLRAAETFPGNAAP